MNIFPILALSAVLAISSLSNCASPTPLATLSISAEALQETAVTVQTADGSGSGVLVANAKGDVFVWTAAHVVTDTKKIRIVKQIQIPGRTVGFVTLDADIVAISKAQDLAILQLKHKDFFKVATRFESANFIPKLGDEIRHIGSFMGIVGAESFSTGEISYVGRVYDGQVFDQMSAPCFPGSSGGAVWNAEGKVIGILVSGYDATFSFFVPVRRMHEWALKEKHPEWLP